MNIWIMMVVTLALGYTAWKDYKTEEISLLAILLMVLVKVFFLIQGFSSEDLISALAGLFVSAIPFIMMAVMGKGGIGDILLIGGLGFTLGIVPIVRIVLLASFLYIIFGTYQMSKLVLTDGSVKDGLRTQYPYAPFVFLAWVIYLFFLLIRR